MSGPKMMQTLTNVPDKALALPVPDLPSLEDWLYVIEDEQREAMSVDESYLDHVELPPPRINTTRLAERHVHYLERLHRELDQVRAEAAAQREKVDAWERRRVRRLEKSVSWNEAGLEAYLQSINAKTCELINGVVRRRKGREKVEVFDLDQFLANAPEALVRVKREADKAAIMRHYKATGEILDGTEVVVGEPSISVAFASGSQAETAREPESERESWTPEAAA